MAMMKFKWELKNQLEQAPSSLSLEDHALQMQRGDPGAVHRAAQKAHCVWRISSTTTGHLYNTQHQCMTSGIVEGIKYSTLHCHQEQSKVMNQLLLQRYESHSNDFQIQRHCE